MQNVKPQDVYSAETPQTAPDTDDLSLEGPKVPEGKVVRIETFFAIDLTTSNKTIRVGFDRAGTKFWLQREAAGTGKYGIRLRRPLILVENERPICMIESPTASDECKLIARGVYL